MWIRLLTTAVAVVVAIRVSRAVTSSEDEQFAAFVVLLALGLLAGLAVEYRLARRKRSSTDRW